MEILAERMRILRKEKKLRQSDIAKILSISLNSYQRYEANEREPMAPFIVAFADYFSVSSDYLLGRTDER